MAEERTFTLEEIKAMREVFKNDPASTTLTGAQLHGPLQNSTTLYGPFADAGRRPDMYSAMVRPSSFARLLGAPQRAEVANELIDIHTGVTEPTGTNATGWCGNPPDVTGHLKKCTQKYIFGQYFGKTTLQAIPEIGKLKDRADVPRNILNGGQSDNPLIPDLMFRLDDTRSQLRYNLWQLGQSFELAMEYVAIQGNSTLSSANTRLGWMKEPDGLDRRVKTGHVNLDTETTCPAADSYVIDFSANITGTTADGRTFEQVLVDLAYTLETRAADVGMEGVQFAIVMRREEFRRATEVIACNYAISTCTGATDEPVSRDGAQIAAMRDAMFNGRYLLLRGVEYPVVFSSGLANPATANNTYESDLFMLPISWMGRQLLYLEYFPMDNQYIKEYAEFGGKPMMTLNNGLYGVFYRDTGACLEYHFVSQMRMILDTPFLAGRIDNVQYSYLPQTRDPNWGNSFYSDGGVSYTS